MTSFVNEPHEAICSDLTAPTLNLVAAEHDPLRSTSVELVSGSPERVISLVRRAAAMQGRLPFDVVPTLDMPARHALELQDVDPRRLESVLLTTYERAPQDFETLLGIEGVGARTLRALALVSEVIYGAPASMRVGSVCLRTWDGSASADRLASAG